MPTGPKGQKRPAKPGKRGPYKKATKKENPRRRNAGEIVA